MSNTLKNIKIPYPTEGVIRSAQLNDTVTPENSVQIAINMNFDRVGAVQTRPGVTAYSPQRTGAIMAFGSLQRYGPLMNIIYSQVGADISALIAGVWTTMRTLSTGANKARFGEFLNRIWMVNGNNGDVPMTSGGGTFDTTYVPANFPKGDFISCGFEGRVWVADVSSDAVYFTDIVQFTPPNTYNFTYDPVANYVKNLSPHDGQYITGLFRVPRALLVFRTDSIIRIYGAYSVDPYPAYNVGTYSQESIVQAKDGIYFHHSSGFYKFTYDSQPTEISRRVIDFVKAIPVANYENVKGVWDGFDNIMWAVGPVTVEGVVYSNCVMRYTISTQVWTIYDYPMPAKGQTPAGTITAMIRHNDDFNIMSLMGTSNGLIGWMDHGTTDFGDSIYYELIDRWRSYTEMYSRSKNISGIMVMTENAAGARLEYQIEKSPTDVWTYIDTVKNEYDALFPNANTDDFNAIRLRISGNTSGEPMVFAGIEILSIQDKGLDEN